MTNYLPDLYGSNNNEATTIDMIIETDTEFTDRYSAPLFLEKDQSKKVNNIFI